MYPSSDVNGNEGRHGKPFSVRIDEEERKKLVDLEAEARPLMDWDHRRRYGSLGRFVVWAAMQWRPPAPAKKAKPRRKPRRAKPRARKASKRRARR